MRNPFVVGETYRNRDGEYKVVELDEPKMVIRYTDGRMLETKVALQARIRANMQAERSIREEARQRAAHKKRSSRKKASFTGLQEHDFQRGTAGTTWRSRTSLGGLLAQELSAETGQNFQSFAIYRRAEAHIVRPKCYHNSLKRSWRDGKLVFDLSAEGARYGLYIEKNSGPMDETWHWPALLAALNADEALQQSTLAAMRRQGLEWEVYAGPEAALTARVAAGKDQLAWRPEEGEEEAIGWPEFLQRLSQLDEGEWCDLYLCARAGKTEAIAAGATITERVVAVYRELLPLYDAAVGESDS